MCHGHRQEHQDSRRLHDPAQLPGPADHGSVICVREQTHVIPVESSGLENIEGWVWQWERNGRTYIRKLAPLACLTSKGLPQAGGD